MFLVGCDVQWSATADGTPVCTGTLQVQEVQPPLSIEDAQELLGHSVVLFAVVFGVLALKKAL